METIQSSPVNQQVILSKQVEHNNSTQQTPKQKKNGKKLLLAGAAATAVIGTAVVMMTKKGNINKATEAFENMVNKASRGNNNILSDSIKKQSDDVEKFISDNPAGWEKIKNRILELVDIKNADEVLEDNILYHGTNIESAKNILTQGVTPFSEKRGGSASGIGYGFYTTSDLEAAKFYSGGKILLPFKVNGKVAVLKEGVKPDNIKLNVMAMAGEIMDPSPKGSLFYIPNEATQKFVKENQSFLTTKAMQELGIDAIYTKGATSRGGVLNTVFNQAPEFLDEADQIAIYNGNSVEFLAEKAKELNPITSTNYRHFI